MPRKQSGNRIEAKYGIDLSKPAAEYMKVSELKRWVKNPRNNKKAVAKAVESIKMFGWGNPLLVREADREIIAGDTRIQAAEVLGIEFVPVRKMPLSSKKAHALAIADNRLNEIATWDKKKRDDALVEFKDDIPLFEATGYKYDDYFKPPAEPIGDDEVPEAPRVPKVKEGEIWKLGNHLLVCGDSFIDNVRECALGKSMVDLVVTDPPFAIYGSSTGIGTDIADDKMVRPFFEKVFGIIGERLKEFGHAYLCCDWRSWAAVWESARRMQITAKNCIVWDKGDGGLGTMYRQCHEFIGFFAKQPPPTAMRSTTKKGAAKIVDGANIMRYGRVTGDERQHNAAKPVEMMKALIQNSSEENDLVVDFFAGSGTTLIAAEHTGRRAVVFEIEPRECDKIIARYERRFEKKAIRA